MAEEQGQMESVHPWVPADWLARADAQIEWLRKAKNDPKLDREGALRVALLEGLEKLESGYGPTVNQARPKGPGEHL